MLQVTFLGVEGYPANGRMTISTLLDMGTHKMLLDCGASIVSQLDAAGTRVADVDAVFVSHLHADHASGLPLMCAGNIMERFTGVAEGAGRLTVVALESVLGPLLGHCKAAYPPLWSENPFTEVVEIPCGLDDRSEVSLPWGQLVSLPTDHAIPSAAAAVQTDEGKVCYCSDTRPVAGLRQLADGADLLICDVMGPNEGAEVASKFGFMTPDQAGQLASDAAAKRLALIHIADHTQRAKCVDQAGASFGGSVIAPNNGETLGL